jgi:hypothetical protein
MTARDEVIKFLKEELVGPRPGLPFVQLNKEEVLFPEDPPRLRYGVGILFPSKQNLDEQEDHADAFAADSSENDSEGGSDSDGNATGEIDDRADKRGDSQSENDHELNRANEFLPSAMGLTVLMKVPPQITVSIDAAQYRKVELSGEGYKNKDDKWVATPYWFRTPLNQFVEVDGAQLLDSKNPITEIELKSANPDTRLILHIYSRSVGLTLESDDPEVRFVTFTLVNRTHGDARPRDEDCFYQCGLKVSGGTSEPCFIDYPERLSDGAENSEELTLELLYRHQKVFAVGHGCSADWSVAESFANSVWSSSLPVYEVPPILAAAIDGLELSMRTLSESGGDAPLDLCRQLVDGYENWISERHNEARDVPEHLKQTAVSNLASCRECLKRMRSGLDLIKSNPKVRQAFALMNRSMLMQHAHYELATNRKRNWRSSGKGLELEAVYEEPNYSKSDRMWRPFQLAFVLMSVRSIVLEKEEDIKEREIVDLIWFPTGGGKTEAYLGLTAFTIFWRRLANPRNSGTTALMRYTLRLLTTQQFQRAASLICACEKIRREDPAGLGESPITIGLWVGGGVTPNTEKSAVQSLNKLLQGDRENPFIVLACPWCGAQMGPVRDGRRNRIKGYRKLTNPNRVRLICEDPDCDFHEGDGLPLQVIDEHLYSFPPTLIIGTVDKFALLPWYPKARAFFGMGNEETDPPDLIIQDELHLISGPLGSMVGHYETVIGALARREDGGRKIPAKIVASTATIARASQQISALYGGRKSCLFPPQALRAGDSFFAVERSDLPGRTYVGVFASGLPSQTTTEVRVLSSILQAPLSIEGYGPEKIDPYWTSMVYFNSIRELGHAATLLRADIPEYMSVTWRRLGLEKKWGDEAASRRRFINSDMELTSRVQNSEITEYMERLFVKYPRTGDINPVDVCLATNMIQVGLDVQRLSIMAIVGQPKTTSEYIQASSRVGRSGDGPGVVFTILSPAKPRDRSHFEHFRAFHQSIYRFVEPTSVTPFALPVIERALHALVVTLARFWGDDVQMEYSNPPSDQLESRIREEIMDRVQKVEPDEVARVLAVLGQIFMEWKRLPPDVYGSFSDQDRVVPMMYPSGTHPKESWDQRSYATPSSMRNVDANCNAKEISSFPDISENGE